MSTWRLTKGTDMAGFTAASTITPRDEASDCADYESEFDVVLDAQWSVDTKLHGGYLLAILGRAAAHAAGSGYRHLTAISGSFLVPPEPGPALVRVEVLRAGRSSAQLRARLIQHGVPSVEALITQGRITQADSWWSLLDPVELPDEQDCFLVPCDAPAAGFSVPLMDVVEQRLDPGVLGFAVGAPSGRGVIAGWQRLADGTDWDPLSLLIALDPVPPVSYDLGVPGWTPSVSLTAYIRALPAPGPVRVRMQATEITDDRMDEVAHVWDARGRLVAQSTQIAAIRVPA